MHTEILTRTKNTEGNRKVLKKVLVERFIYDDDEFDIRLYCNHLEACINAGTREECNNALERIQALGLKTRIETYGNSDYLEVFP